MSSITVLSFNLLSTDVASVNIVLIMDLQNVQLSCVPVLQHFFANRTLKVNLCLTILLFDDDL